MARIAGTRERREFDGVLIDTILLKERRSACSFWATFVIALQKWLPRERRYGLVAVFATLPAT